MGRSAEGLPYIDAILSTEPDFTYGLYAKILLLADLGRIAEAESLLPKVQSKLPSGYLFPTFVLPCILALQRDDSTGAERLLKEILNRINDPKAASVDVGGVFMQLLPFLARHRRIEPALDILKRYIEVGTGLSFYDSLVLDPCLEPLRRDARIQPLLEEYRKDCVDRMKVLARARARGELPRYLDAPFVDLLKKLDIQL